MRRSYVVARNRSGRPTLQHLLSDGYTTVCGVEVTDWSRAYQSRPIHEIFCQRCKVRS